MELDFTVLAVDVDSRSAAKDIGCYVHMDGELLDVITPIRDKIGQENTLTLAVGERPGTLKLLVKRMGESEELLGSASVPISVFAAMPASEFARLWVKLSSDPDSDLFIPASEDTERPRLLVAYRTRGKSMPKVASPAPLASPHNRQQRIWDLEAELEVTKTELRYEQERAGHSSQDKEKIKALEMQLQDALEAGDEEEKYGELLRQFREFMEKQRAVEVANEGRIRDLVEENSGLKGDLAAKQHHITTLASEVAYLTQCLALEKANKPLVTEISALSLEANEEISQLQQRLSELQAENHRLRRETDTLPSRKEELRSSPGDPRTPKSDKALKRPQSDTLEGLLNSLLPKYGFPGKVTRVVEGIYLLGNRRIHAKLQGAALLTQLGGTSDWVGAEDLLSKLKEEGEAKSARRSCSVGQEGELPKEDPKPKPPSKLLRDFSPILKKKK